MQRNIYLNPFVWTATLNIPHTWHIGVNFFVSKYIEMDWKFEWLLMITWSHWNKLMILRRVFASIDCKRTRLKARKRIDFPILTLTTYSVGIFSGALIGDTFIGTRCCFPSMFLPISISLSSLLFIFYIYRQSYAHTHILKARCSSQLMLLSDRINGCGFEAHISHTFFQRQQHKSVCPKHMCVLLSIHPFADEHVCKNICEPCLARCCWFCIFLSFVKTKKTKDFLCFDINWFGFYKICGGHENWSWNWFNFPNFQ